MSLLVVPDGADNLEKSEVQAIIESTPELDMDLDGCRGTRYRTDDAELYMCLFVCSSQQI